MSNDQKRILVVDDDKDIRAALRLYLESNGQEVTEAESGDDAIGIFEEKRREHGFDLVILDQVMPGSSGLVVFEKIQKIDARTPTIMLTGFPTISLAIRFIQLGGINFLTKPFDPFSKILDVIIHEAINYKRIKRAQAAAVYEGSLEFLNFQDDEVEEVNITYANKPWKVLIADDDDSIHGATKLVLGNFVFDGRPLEFYSVHSADEAKAWLDDNFDVALVLADTFMETEFAGFEIVKHIRGTMGNRLIRIILRSVNFGDLPEHKVVLDHEIDGFLTKQDNSIQRLAIMVTTTIRAYRDLLIIEKYRQKEVVELKASKQKINSLHARIKELEGQLASGHLRAS